MQMLIAGSQPSRKGVFIALEGAARRMGLRIRKPRENKIMITNHNAKQSESTTIGN
jgi:hypothetical protein